MLPAERSALLRLHPDDGHHAGVLVIENVTMVEEIAHNRAAEIHPYLDVWIFACAVPVADLVRIPPLLLIFRHGLSIFLQNLEVNLVHVKFMNLERTILDDPILHSAFPGDDRG